MIDRVVTIISAILLYISLCAGVFASTMTEKSPAPLLYKSQTNLTVDIGNRISASTLNDLQIQDVTKLTKTAANYFLRQIEVQHEASWTDNISCEVCHVVVGTVREMIERSSALEDILNFVIDACIGSHIVEKEICTMGIHEYQDQLIYIFEHLALSPKEVCSIALKHCGQPIFPGPSWKVRFPPNPKPAPQPPQPPQPHAPTIRFLQLTDIHIDLSYKKGAPADCKQPLCCRYNNARGGSNYNGTLSANRGAGKYGEYTRCDAAPAMVHSLFQHLSSIQDKFDYILFTGDIPAHDIWNQTRDDQLEHVRLLDNFFTTYLPHKPVFHTVGNHDSAPCNSFPPPGIPNHNSSWLFDELADVWGRWLPKSELSNVRRCAQYSHSPYPGFRIISVNNNYCNSLNFWLLLNSTDPCGSLQWLVGELQKAEDNGEKVHILMHIPPGEMDCLGDWSWNYYSIVNRYENTITNQFHGHTHNEYFEMFYDESNLTRPLGFGFVAPSTTPWPHLNPIYRIYTMDGNYQNSSWAVLDYTNYYFNITEANETNKPLWKFVYSAKKEYKMDSMYAADWNDLIERMEKDDHLFQKFHKNYHGIFPDTQPCHYFCKFSTLCKLKEGRSYDPLMCL